MTTATKEDLAADIARINTALKGLRAERRKAGPYAETSDSDRALEDKWLDEYMRLSDEYIARFGHDAFEAVRLATA